MDCALLVLLVVVVVVAIDAIGRLDERWRREDQDEAVITMQKIVVDLTARGGRREEVRRGGGE